MTYTYRSVLGRFQYCRFLIKGCSHLGAPVSVSDRHLRLDDPGRQSRRGTELKISVPSSKASFLRNLKQLCEERVGLPALVDYHDLNVRWRSSRSYALVITQAIRHTSYGTAESLFRLMKEDGIHEGHGIFRLRVRLLVRTGHWDEALNEAILWTAESGNRLLWTERKGSGLPLGIWVELLPTRMPKRETKEKGMQVLTERFQRMGQVAPSRFPEAMPFGAVYHTIQGLLLLGQEETAYGMAARYLGNLPAKISGRQKEKCISMVELFLVQRSKKGLEAFLAKKKKIMTLAALHGGIVPRWRTVKLLVGHLGLGEMRMRSRGGTRDRWSEGK